jgi:hypothetical protein
LDKVYTDQQLKAGMQAMKDWVKLNVPSWALSFIPDKDYEEVAVAVLEAALKKDN